MFASTAAAADINLSSPVVSRSSSEAVDNGYLGPLMVIGSSGKTSHDWYYCPSPEVMSGFIVPPDNGDSYGRSYSVTTLNAEGGYNNFPLWVTNWSQVEVHLRLAASCTNNSRVYRFYDPESYAYGDWIAYWTAALFNANGQPRSPTASEYGVLIQRALCWVSNISGCPRFVGSAAPAAPARVRARRGGNRFALRNGTNRISMTFRHTAGGAHTAQDRRPPAVRLAGANGCRARRMSLVVHNGRGQMELVLRCARQKRGAVAHVRVVKAVRQRFRLRGGTGTVRVKLAKPPGTVEPLSHVSYGRAGRACRKVRHRLRSTTRTHDLAITARCGRGAGNGTGHLFVGGLLAVPR